MINKEKKRNRNEGISLIELIVVVAIMAVLMGVLAPNMIRYVGKARQARVEKEASELMECARLAYIEVYALGKEPDMNQVGHSVKNNKSPYYKSGTKYGNITNWTVKNGTASSKSNGPLAEAFLETLGVPYGATKWKTGTSTVPVSNLEPKQKEGQAGSTTGECIFQLFYDQNGNMVIEYSRYGFFVRMDGPVIVDSYKVKSSDVNFTQWN